MSSDLSLAEARRIALAAQGFADPAPRGTVDRRLLRRVFARVGVIQIDSVNVVVRSHYLPAFSRLGPYDREVLERAAYGRDRTLFEYWGHEASLLPVELQPLLRWRMERAKRGIETWGRIARMVQEQPGTLKRLRATIAERGPMAASGFEGARGKGSWWGWSDVKIALEALFWCGEITTAYRKGFERVYDLPERVLPPAILDAPTPSEEDAQRELIRIAARATGIASERDLRDYFRLDLAGARARVAELVDAGELQRVQVHGLRGDRYLARNARLPRRIDARALLSPFDSVVWERSRNRELFEFDFRLEIYTPQHKRVHGYYVLPFLLGDRLVARVDLKHDRQAGILRAHAVDFEAHAARNDVLPALRTQLDRMADWLGAGRVVLPKSAHGRLT
ncbi:MAG TPA: crosslink repair DNA glycosylase YcaQ family protein [Candidatus Limnocylindrales bacterium]|nr:crosslink repair DNA glycosylase YcaQ family protein [Candidatus Limnocylindrales bacterium]